MKCIKALLIFLISVASSSIQAQFINSDLTDSIENSTAIDDTVALPELIVRKKKVNLAAQKEFMLLQSRVYKTYPYAKMTSEKLTELNKGLMSLKTEKEKRKYFKIVENYLTNEFEDKLKKLSHKQGQILVKLIHRQTGKTTYELISNLKSGWKAFWSNVTAKIFHISLKKKYEPYKDNEDYVIESILVFAFQKGHLQNQPPAIPIDYEALNATWQSRVKKLSK